MPLLAMASFRPAKPSCLLSLYDFLCAGERIRRYSSSILQALAGLKLGSDEVILATEHLPAWPGSGQMLQNVWFLVGSLDNAA